MKNLIDLSILNDKECEYLSKLLDNSNIKYSIEVLKPLNSNEDVKNTYRIHLELLRLNPSENEYPFFELPLFFPRIEGKIFHSRFLDYLKKQ